ncbi:MAG: hypothetical protein PUB20_06675 [Clostridia bacterium]|nr:hypothetical protein [Clostridia bacterium]
MSEIILPKKIIFGSGSLKDNPFSDFTNAVLISDCKDILRLNSFFTDDKSKPTLIPQISILINESTDKLIEFAAEKMNSNSSDLLIAAGSPSLFDKASELAVDYSAELSVIPSCGLTDLPFSPPMPPQSAILVPQLICTLNSIGVAYRSASALALCIDAYINSEDEVMCEIIINTAQEIERNMIPAYRGEIASLFRLYYALFVAGIIAYSFKSDTPLRKAVTFFTELGTPASGTAAVCLPNAIEFNNSAQDKCAELSNRFKISERSTDPVCTLSEYLRRKFAAIGIQRSVNAFYADEWRYNLKSDEYNELKPLLDNCFYGSRRFVRL